MAANPRIQIVSKRALPRQPESITGKQTKVIVVTTAMLTFISFWRVSAIVLCDLASTAYYIGGIVEEAVGPLGALFHPSR